MNLIIVLTLSLSFGAIFCYFDAELTEGRAIRGTGEINYEGTIVKRINRTTYAGTGSFEVNAEIDNTYEMSLNFYKKQGNEYRLTPFHSGPNNFCDFIKNDSFFYEDLQKCSNSPQKGVCPWPKGTYKLDQCLLPMNKIPRYFDGEYRLDVEITKNGEVSGGYQVFFYIIKDGN